LLLDNGNILSVYHHWDGYPEALGAKLTKEYTTKDAVSDLIDGGDISTCMSRSNWDGQPTVDEFVLYYKDRGDLDVDPQLSDDEREFFALTRGCDGEYAYVFDPVTKVWSCYDMHGAVTVPLYAELVA
jgi:hypothetical protein